MEKGHAHCCNGVSSSFSGHYSDTKHILVLVDSDEQQRQEVVNALTSFYNIIEFDSTLPAVEYIRQDPPGVVVISESAAPRGGFEMARELRNMASLRSLPVVLILDNEGSGAITSAVECGASGWVVKPYRVSELITKISGQFNATIEAQWKALPEVEARTLAGTVRLFNSISDLIQKGEPIVFAEANEACAPLVEAVNSGDFKGILNGVRDHDNYTYAHSLRVAVFLSLFGKTIGLSVSEQKQLATGGLLHDVGKMFIPHLVLNKPGRLTSEESAIMRSHVTETEKLLTGADIPRAVITIAAQHHEKLDGSGYPRGLKGDDLNDLARMVAIVDVFSALTDRRVYKPSMSAEKALSIMTEEMGTHLDMTLLARFRKMLLDAAVEA